VISAEQNASQDVDNPDVIAAQCGVAGSRPASSPPIIAAVIADMLTGIDRTAANAQGLDKAVLRSGVGGRLNSRSVPAPPKPGIFLPRIVNQNKKRQSDEKKTGNRKDRGCKSKGGATPAGFAGACSAYSTAKKRTTIKRSHSKKALLANLFRQGARKPLRGAPQNQARMLAKASGRGETETELERTPRAGRLQ